MARWKVVTLALALMAAIPSAVAQELPVPTTEGAFLLFRAEGGGDEIVDGTVAWRAANRDGHQIVEAAAEFAELGATFAVVIGPTAEGDFTIEIALDAPPDFPITLGGPVILAIGDPDMPGGLTSLDGLETPSDVGPGAWRITYRGGLSAADLDRIRSTGQLNLIFTAPGEEIVALGMVKGESGAVAMDLASADWPAAGPAPTDHPPAGDYAPFSLDPDLPGILFLDGDLTEDAGAAFIAALLDHPETTLLALRSEGGIGGIGRGMAELIAEFGIDTVVPYDSFCYSACMLVFYAGANRLAFGELGVHQITALDPTPDPAAILEGVASNAQLWARFDAPLDAVMEELRTPPTTIRIFTADEVAALGFNRGRLEDLRAYTPALLDHPGFATAATLFDYPAGGSAETSAGNVIWRSATILGEAATVTAEITFPDRDLTIEIAFRGGAQLAFPTSHEIAVRLDGTPIETGELVGMIVQSTVGGNVWLPGDFVEADDGSQVLSASSYYYERVANLLMRNRFILLFDPPDGRRLFVVLDLGHEGSRAMAAAAPSWSFEGPEATDTEADFMAVEADGEAITYRGSITWEAGLRPGEVGGRIRIPALDLWGRIYFWWPSDEARPLFQVEFSEPVGGRAARLDRPVALSAAPTRTAPAKRIAEPAGTGGFYRAELVTDITTLTLLERQRYVTFDLTLDDGSTAVLSLERNQTALGYFAAMLGDWSAR